MFGPKTCLINWHKNYKLETFRFTAFFKNKFHYMALKVQESVMSTVVAYKTVMDISYVQADILYNNQ